MSGRGRGHGRYNRAALGTDRLGNETMRNHPNNKTLLGDYRYYLGSAKQPSDFKHTTNYLINHIRKTFTFGNDIATALNELKPYDMALHRPGLRTSVSMSMSVSEDPEQRKAEEMQNEILLKAEFEAFIRRKEALEVNMSKAYRFLWEQCSKGMQNKIESRCDFESNIKGDPIELLKAIKQYTLTTKTIDMKCQSLLMQ